jgi:Phosphoesterase family
MISHSWDASHGCRDGGRNDGFVQNRGPESMYYLMAEQVPYYFALGQVSLRVRDSLRHAQRLRQYAARGGAASHRC